MLALPVVRPINEMEVQHLENEFVMGYCEGDCAMYLSIYNDDNKVLDVSHDIVTSWSTYWKEANYKFEAKLADDLDLAPLSGKMFFWWDGNHCLTAWLWHINKFHGSDKEWHYAVDNILVDPRGCIAMFINTMNDINWLVPPFFT